MPFGSWPNLENDFFCASGVIRRLFLFFPPTRYIPKSGVSGLSMIFFQTGLRAKPLFSSTPYKPAQAPHSRFFRWHVYQHARRSSASYMPIYAPTRHVPAHGTRLASLRYGICTAAASAIILQAAPDTPSRDWITPPVSSLRRIFKSKCRVTTMPSKMVLALVLHPPGGLTKPKISRRVVYLGHGSTPALAWRK